MKLKMRLGEIAILVLTVRSVYAVPSFARQTGLSCNVCHRNPPQLTAFGRNFKLKGYVLTDILVADKVGNTKELLLSKYIPLSVTVLLSNTSSQVAHGLPARYERRSAGKWGGSSPGSISSCD